MSKRTTLINAYTSHFDHYEVETPIERAVCPECDGEGVHDHPAFAQGLTPEEFGEDPDFSEEYMSGAYDVRCSRCNGLRVIDEPQVCLLTEAQQEDIYRYQAAEDDSRAEAASERRMGA